MKWLLLLVLFLPSFANAAACTAGTDCYCDNVANSGHADYDANLLFCEDFEAPSMRSYDTSREGNGSPYYGPWHDETDGGGTCNRGYNSYWRNNYGNGVNSVIWNDGEPSSPSLGCSCNVGGRCEGTKIWSENDDFDANSLDPVIAILTSGEFDEVAGNGDPTNAEGGGSGQFDGTASLHHRIEPNVTGGVLGEAGFTKSTEIGVTMAMAFALNLADSGIVAYPWKFNEFGNLLDGAFWFGRENQWDADTPFVNFVFYDGLTTANCNSRVSSATITLGEMSCDPGDSGAMEWRVNASDGVYDRSDDWAYGTWGCLRAHYTGIGTSNTTIKQWFKGPGDSTETLVIDISGLNTTDTGMDNGGAGYSSMSWNNFANANQGQGETPTTETTGRYEDNIHITNGTPVSCEQIGFGDTASTSETNPSIYMLSLLAAVFTPLLDTLKDAIDTLLEDQPGRIWAAFYAFFAVLFSGLMIWRNRVTKH